MPQEDASREAKLQELQKRLELEFSQMHENQAKVISETEERLDSLKKLHQERGLNRDKIVQRRIDELLGKTDALQWNAGPPRQTVYPDIPTYRPSGTYLTPSSTLGPGSTIGVLREHSPSPVDPAQAATESTELRIPSPPNPPTYYSPGPPATVQVIPAPRNNLGEPDTPAPSSLAPQATVDSLPRQTSVERVDQDRSDSTLSATTERVADSAALIGKLFTLARNSADANAELPAAKAELERVQKLRTKGGGAITPAELQNAELKVKRLQREVDFNTMEFDALAEAFRRDRELAAAALDRAREKLETVAVQVQQGLSPTEKLMDAQYQLTKAEKEFRDADANLQQLERARKVVDAPEKEQQAEGSGL
jgi:hypothetical protein